MPPTSVPLDDPAVDPDPPRRSTRRTVSLVAAAVFVVATFGFWIYAFFLYDPGLKVDELADRTFPTAAVEVCDRYEARVDQLPLASASPTAADRADVIDEANTYLGAMVEELATIAPTGEGRDLVEAWLADWRTHVADRQAYADSLRTDEDARFLETIKGNRQLSRAIDGFAEVNRMEACSTPGDVG